MDKFIQRKFSSTSKLWADKPDAYSIFERAQALNKALLDHKKEKEQEKELKQAKDIEEREQQEIWKENLKTNPENFLSQSRNRINEFLDKQEKIEENLEKRIYESKKKLNEKEEKEIDEKFGPVMDKHNIKANDKAFSLEGEFPHDLKPVGYFVKKVDIESSSFKKTIQLKQKEEEEVDKKIREKPDFSNFKEKYEEERSKWREELQKDVKSCREEKQNIKEFITSKVQKPSEIAQDLVEESPLDYTGGDD